MGKEIDKPLFDFSGIEVKVDPNIPENEIQLRDKEGNILKRIINVDVG